MKGMRMSIYTTDPVTTTDSGIRVGICREDQPDFRRIYNAIIGNGIHIELEAYSFLGSRSWRGELRQKDGRCVWFEPQRVADKILDPILVPMIEEVCAEIFDLDKAYIKYKPNSFTDKSGTVWVRAT
jgi:hypothetical protein